MVAAAAYALFMCNAIAQEPCKLTAIGPANVAAVRDGRILLLSDGRELRLAGIEVTNDSRAALQALVAGRPLRLERLASESLGSERDRCGRLTPRRTCRSNCSSKARRGYRRASATRPAPMPF
jgi:hypothetical protein